MNDPEVHVGLGATSRVERVQIRWPSGIQQQFDDLKANQLLIITEGQSTLSQRTP
jgi:hypothetical protein